MKTLLLTGLCLLVFTISKSQTISAPISITLKNVVGETFIAKQQGLKQTYLPFNKGKYDDKLDGPALFTLANHDEVLTIYAEPGTQLTIRKKERKGLVSYTFRGKGSAENNFMARLIKAQQKFLPVDGDILTDKVNMIPPADFINRLTRYQAISKQMLDTYNADLQFVKIQKDYIDCKVHTYALQYFEDYGNDPVEKKIYLEKLTNGDPSLNDPAVKQAALDKVYKKELTFNDRKLITPFMYNGVDINNETLFKYSTIYSNLVIGTISHLTRPSGDVSFAKQRIEFIKQNVSNAYIKQELFNKYEGDL